MTLSETLDLSHTLWLYSPNVGDSRAYSTGLNAKMELKLFAKSWRWKVLDCVVCARAHDTHTPATKKERKKKTQE